jgi:hypothetical protein
MLPAHRAAPRRAAILAFATIAVLALPFGGAHAADTIIQPGAEVTSSAGQCTLNFVFRGTTGKLYIGTAGHCVTRANERMYAATGEAFGTAVFSVDHGNDDFTLIDIDASKLSLVNPAVRSFGGPKGYTTSSTVALGDELEIYGYGAGFGLTEPTRPRYGVLIDADANSYRAETMAVPGDSGGPFLQARTGKALGIVSHTGIDDTHIGGLTFPSPHTDIGPTVERILALCSAAGYKLTLVTA